MSLVGSVASDLDALEEFDYPMDRLAMEDDGSASWSLVREADELLLVADGARFELPKDLASPVHSRKDFELLEARLVAALRPRDDEWKAMLATNWPRHVCQLLASEGAGKPGERWTVVVRLAEAWTRMLGEGQLGGGLPADLRGRIALRARFFLLSAPFRRKEASGGSLAPWGLKRVARRAKAPNGSTRGDYRTLSASAFSILTGMVSACLSAHSCTAATRPSKWGV